jgi:hypothetical protein
MIAEEELEKAAGFSLKAAQAFDTAMAKRNEPLRK